METFKYSSITSLHDIIGTISALVITPISLVPKKNRELPFFWNSVTLAGHGLWPDFLANTIWLTTIFSFKLRFLICSQMRIALDVRRRLLKLLRFDLKKILALLLLKVVFVHEEHEHFWADVHLVCKGSLKLLWHFYLILLAAQSILRSVEDQLDFLLDDLFFLNLIRRLVNF